QPTPTPTAPAPNGAIGRADLAAARLTLPAWPAGVHCPTGTVRVAATRPGGGGGRAHRHTARRPDGSGRLRAAPGRRRARRRRLAGGVDAAAVADLHLGRQRLP